MRPVSIWDQIYTLNTPLYPSVAAVHNTFGAYHAVSPAQADATYGSCMIEEIKRLAGALEVGGRWGKSR